MPNLVAFSSLPFGLRGGTYRINTPSGDVDVHVAAQQFTPYMTITSRPELAQTIPADGEGEGFRSYTWYDHPFVLRVVFGRNVASLGSVNSCATIAQPLRDSRSQEGGGLLDQPPALDAVRAAFATHALAALNNLVAVIRREARLYQLQDLRREDIEITVRRDDGTILREDPMHAALVREQEAMSTSFDLVAQSDDWYAQVAQALRQESPISLADDLLIEAERALRERFPRQAIATCHTAIEAATSGLLTRAMQARGLLDDEIDDELSTRSLTSKLASMLRKYTGSSLRAGNLPLWRDFGRLNDLRNDIVHRGQPPSDADAEFAIGVTRQLIAWLDVVRQRNASSLG